MRNRTITENNGNFPDSVDKLIEQGMLKQVVTDGKTEYYLRAGEDDNWRELYDFPEYKILYGADPKSMSIVNDQLIDIETKEPVLLIDGPYKLIVEATYKNYSKSLYKRMTRIASKGQQNDVEVRRSDGD